MKGIDILCASQASTAICMMDEGSSSSTIHLGRAIDRYNPIIRDSTRTPKSLNDQTPITPKPHRHTNTSTRNPKPASKASSSSKRNKNIDDLQKKKSISISTSTSNSNSDDDLQKRKSISSIISGVVNSHKQSMSESRKGGWGCTRPGDFISPPGSTRYLLSDNNSNKSLLMDLDPNQILNPVQVVKKEESSVSLPPPTRNPDQVVVLRVSLHCKGCEKKMRKHLSRMEGVSSFNIDFAAKKITVVGDISPLSVLSSVSKVKNAQLLGPVIPSSTPTSVISEYSRIEKLNTVVV